MLRRLRSSIKLVFALACVAGGVWVSAQTKIVAPKNKFPVQTDVEEGQKAAAEIEKQLPVFPDPATTAYIQGIGARLAGMVPAEFQHPEFKYTFKVVDVKDINAFALPGGPMYVHRGIIEASRSEGEMAGVMAHELSHVALRHGTAQMTKAESPWARLGAIAGAVGGSVVGGSAGSLIIQGTSFTLNSAFLRFSRDYEKQADLLGVQMMARAGYDPRDLAHMFETIEKEGGGRDPQFFSDHPNPGNRVEYINEEAKHVTIAPSPPAQARPAAAPAAPEGIVVPGRAAVDGSQMSFAEVQARLKSFAPAPTMQELAKRAQEQQQRGR